MFFLLSTLRWNVHSRSFPHFHRSLFKIKHAQHDIAVVIHLQPMATTSTSLCESALSLTFWTESLRQHAALFSPVQGIHWNPKASEALFEEWHEFHEAPTAHGAEESEHAGAHRAEHLLTKQKNKLEKKTWEIQMRNHKNYKWIKIKNEKNENLKECYGYLTSLLQMVWRRNEVSTEVTMIISMSLIKFFFNHWLPILITYGFSW